MITALVSGLFGLINAFAPDVLGWFKKKQEMQERREERQHEKDMALLQMDIQVKLGQQKLEAVLTDSIIGVIRDEMNAQAEQMKYIYEAQQPIGVKWVDAWNAALRPAACTTALLVFYACVACVIWSAVQLVFQGTMEISEIPGYVLGGLVGEFIQAVLGYLFGYRGYQGAQKLVQVLKR
jgi:hypothetical protein